MYCILGGKNNDFYKFISTVLRKNCRKRDQITSF